MTNLVILGTNLEDHNEKMTIDEVKELKIVLLQRKKAVKWDEEGFAYNHLLRIIDEVLPIENSLEERLAKKLSDSIQ